LFDLRTKLLVSSVELTSIPVNEYRTATGLGNMRGFYYLAICLTEARVWHCLPMQIPKLWQSLQLAMQFLCLCIAYDFCVIEFEF